MALKGIFINILFVFFNWLLFIQKDQLSAVSSLQIYWNVFCLMQKKETDCLKIDSLIKSQMHTV